jgi:hypothetical protein
MNHITKLQHHVPAFYIRLWSTQGKDQVICHDLQEKRHFPTSPDGILARRYFYEEDRQAPDNRVEHILSQMEGDCSQCFNALNDSRLRNISHADKSTVALIKGVLTDDNCRRIKQFAAFQYLRVPGAIEQKAFELQTSTLSQEQKDYWLNAGRFVTSGYSYVKGRFLRLKLLVCISTGQDYITSDWPCFDVKDDPNAPLLGEEIGTNPGVVVYLPLTPRLGAVLYPPQFSADGKSQITPSVIVNAFSDAEVRNQNTLVIQQADRYVVADSPKEFIFRVAAKRKKANVLPPAGPPLAQSS